MKSPVAAAVLNIIPGLGYLYLGTRKIFAILLLISLPIMVVEVAMHIGLYELLLESIWLTIVDFIITVAFMIDAYFEGRRINAGAGRPAKTT